MLENEGRFAKEDENQVNVYDLNNPA